MNGDTPYECVAALFRSVTRSEEPPMNNRCVNSLVSVLATAAVIAGMLGSSGCAAPESEKSRAITSSLDADIKAADDKVTAYLQENPVRASLLFDSVSTMLENLGQNKSMTIDQCEYEPEFRDWERLVPGLRENTTVSLRQSFRRGMDKAWPVGGRPVGRSFCAELKRQYNRILHDIQGVGPVLRKQGY